MAPGWKPSEVKEFSEVVRNHSVTNQIDVTDNTWKAHLPNSEAFEKALKKKDTTWRWDASQMLTKWKNVLQDYYNVKSNNSNTGAIRRTATCMFILDDLVAPDNPNIVSKKLKSTKNPPKSSATPTSVQDLVEDEVIVEPAPRRQKLNAVDKALIEALKPELTKGVTKEVAEMQVRPLSLLLTSL